MENKDKIAAQTAASEAPAPAVALPRTIHLVPMDCLNGFDVRPGFYEKIGRAHV